MLAPVKPCDNNTGQPSGMFPGSQDRDVDMVVKGGHDCWVAARQVGRRQLILVLEGRAEGGLLEATETTRQFMAAHMKGLLD